MNINDLKDYIENMFTKYNNEDRFGFTIPLKFIDFNKVSFPKIIELFDTYNLILTYFPKDEYIMLEYMSQYYYDKRKNNKEKNII